MTTTIQLELPQEIYWQAEQLAHTTQRSISEVIIEWIQLPQEREGSKTEETLDDLATYSQEKLIQIAQSKVPSANAKRLRKLLDIQNQRPLTSIERQQATALVEQEELLTLKKAKAIFLLKQQNALPYESPNFDEPEDPAQQIEQPIDEEDSLSSLEEFMAEIGKLPQPIIC